MLDGSIKAYVYFKSIDGKRISNSVYPGNINGAAKETAGQELDEQYMMVKERFEKVDAIYK